MKRLSLFVLAVLCTTVMMADPISRQTAQQKATQFMKSQGWTTSSSQQPVLKVRKAATNTANSLYYVFNNDKGYVIVSGDDRAVDILGYSPAGAFDENNMPEGMKDLLAQYANEIAWLQSTDATVTNSDATTTTAKAAIAPLITSKWGQDAPYNNQCPNYTYNGSTKRSATGCAATAMAQIMYYHKWPLTTSKAIPAYTTSTHYTYCSQLPTTTFDWNYMTDTYSNSSSEAANTSVAALMRYCGQSIKMDYSYSSGASMTDIPNALTSYFNYSGSMKLVTRRDYTISEWADIIYTELSASRPVFYSGTSMGGGHAFVCDGYDGNGLFHINWGWDGTSDNYFQLSALNPNTTTTTGSSSIDDGFTISQNAIIGIQKPNESSTTTTPYLSCYKLLSANGSYVTFSGICYCSKNATMSIGMGIDDGNGNITALNTINYYMQNTYVANYSKTLNASMFPGNGTYKVVPIYRESSESVWHTLGISYLVVTIDGSIMSTELHPIINLTADNITFASTPSTTGYNELTFTITNNGEEYNGNLYAFASTTDTKGNYTGIKTEAIAANASVSDNIYLTIPSTDNLTVWLSTDEYANNIIGQKTFQNYDLSIEKTVIVDDPRTIEITIKNNSTMDFSKSIQALLYDKNNKKLSTVTFSDPIAAGGTTVLSLNKATVSLTAGYYLKIQGQLSELTNTYKAIGTVKLEASSTGINGVNVTTSDKGTYYDIMGRKIDINQADSKQIYLHNGKKIIK